MILDLDTALFHLINYEWHNGFLDAVLPVLRNKLFWIPVYFCIVVFIYLEKRARGTLPVLFLILTVALADTVSSRLIKKNVQRLRPCKNELIIEKRTLVRCGSGFSFTSNHAANHFSLSMFLVLLFNDERRWTKWLIMGWAALIAYSQIYVGVHYPLDVMAGAFLGIVIAVFMYFILNKLAN